MMELGLLTIPYHSILDIISFLPDDGQTWKNFTLTCKPLRKLLFEFFPFHGQGSTTQYTNNIHFIILSSNRDVEQSERNHGKK